MSFLPPSCAVVLACGLFVFPAMASDLDPVGQWEISTGESRYRVSHCGEELCAKLTWLRDDARTAENVALLNKTIVRGKLADENKWTGTVVVDGQTYEATVTLVSNDAMRVNSCSGLFCQSFQLNRL